MSWISGGGHFVFERGHGFFTVRDHFGELLVCVLDRVLALSAKRL